MVDDSAFSRRTITRILEGLKNVEVVGFAGNGEEGMQKIIALKPDLVTLDLEMPKMDGFTLLRILTSRFSVPVIVISALSGADKVFKSLELGALDFVAKPSRGASADLLLVKEDLQLKVLQLLSHRPHGVPSPHTTFNRHESRVSMPFNASTEAESAVDIVAIGSSTGGPPALQNIFSSFDQKFPFAIVVSQHMPSGFTKAFADRLNRTCPFNVKEATDGDPVNPGTILIAPGGKNLVLERRAGNVSARVISPTPSDRYLPSVDVMLESCATVYGKRMLAVILTGMGNDGSKGVRLVKEQGGFVIAESQETAVVYGMPREAVATGVVDKVVPLDRVAREILIQGKII